MASSDSAAEPQRAGRDEAGEERPEADERPQRAQQRLALLADAELGERQGGALAARLERRDERRGDRVEAQRRARRADAPQPGAQRGPARAASAAAPATAASAASGRERRVSP